MKNQNLIVLGLAGVAVYMIWQAKKTGKTVTEVAQGFVKEIKGQGGKAFDNGWRYFDNGTSIDPQGNYYYQGQLVYNAKG